MHVPYSEERIEKKKKSYYKKKVVVNHYNVKSVQKQANETFNT